LLTTGLVGLFSPCILIPPCKGGDAGFVCVRYLICVCVRYLICVCLLMCHDFEWLLVFV
jgi:hypothetical protein